MVSYKVQQYMMYTVFGIYTAAIIMLLFGVQFIYIFYTSLGALLGMAGFLAWDYVRTLKEEAGKKYLSLTVVDYVGREMRIELPVLRVEPVKISASFMEELEESPEFRRYVEEAIRRVDPQIPYKFGDSLLKFMYIELLRKGIDRKRLDEIIRSKTDKKGEFNEKEILAEFRKILYNMIGIYSDIPTPLDRITSDRLFSRRGSNSKGGDNSGEEGNPEGSYPEPDDPEKYREAVEARVISVVEEGADPDRIKAIVDGMNLPDEIEPILPENVGITDEKEKIYYMFYLGNLLTTFGLDIGRIIALVTGGVKAGGNPLEIVRNLYVTIYADYLKKREEAEAGSSDGSDFAAGMLDEKNGNLLAAVIRPVVTVMPYHRLSLVYFDPKSAAGYGFPDKVMLITPFDFDKTFPFGGKLTYRNDYLVKVLGSSGVAEMVGSFGTVEGTIPILYVRYAPGMRFVDIFSTEEALRNISGDVRTAAAIYMLEKNNEELEVLRRNVNSMVMSRRMWMALVERMQQMWSVDRKAFMRLLKGSGSSSDSGAGRDGDRAVEEYLRTMGLDPSVMGSYYRGGGKTGARGWLSEYKYYLIGAAALIGFLIYLFFF